MTEEIAEHGWVVEVIWAMGGQTETVFLAIAEHTAVEAESAVLRYPGILSVDKWIARRRLSNEEIIDLKLRALTDLRSRAQAFDRAARRRRCRA